MKIRGLALGAVAALALAAPACASDAVGWYLGLGAGWDRLGNLHTDFAPGGPNQVINTSDAALLIGSFGYRLPNGLRLETELGWDRHDANAFNRVFSTSSGSELTNVGGSVRNLTGMLNAVYDWHWLPQLDFSLGAGIGVSSVDLNLHTSDGLNFANGEHLAYGWQGIAGLTYSVSDNLDLGIDWRYRQFSVRKNFGTAYEPVTGTGGVAPTVRLTSDTEQVVMFGLRYYLFQAAPPPPPPPQPSLPPPPPPPAPPLPPPVKTFIVFFDFNKSNLTSEAQAVVSEAVKTAKQQGSVRILVTGHTDTVGSHSYNQGLSERRASSVKEEMVQQGMDPGDIATEGKSFDEPLVPTGPGVREPQNRRAVIDLGAGSRQ